MNHRMIVFVCLVSLLSSPHSLSAQKRSIATRKPGKRAVASRIIVVTSDNFISFEVCPVWGRGHPKRTLIKAGSVTVTDKIESGHPTDSPARTAVLSPKDMSAIFGILNTAHFPALAGYYDDHSIRDAPSTRVTLVVKQGNKKKAYEVYNCGGTAPKAFYTALDNISSLVKKRLNAHKIHSSPP